MNGRAPLKLTEAKLVAIGIPLGVAWSQEDMARDPKSLKAITQDD